MQFKFRGKQLVIAAAIFLSLIFLHSFDFFKVPERVVFATLAPAQRRFYSVGAGLDDFFKKMGTKQNAGETELLKAQVRSLMVQNARLKIVEEENKILKQELKFVKSHVAQYIGARVMGYDSDRSSNLVLLELEGDAAASDIKEDMPVISDDGILVGKIAFIKENRIYLRFLTSSQSAVAATILNSDYTAGVVEGELNLSIKMNMIAPSENIKQGDMIVTSGLEANLPKGLLIGTVNRVSRDPQAPFNTAFVNPLKDYKTLSEILIIKNY
jgi:rod shape-determining protein MreC